jgi:hypothetical protein
LISPTVTLLLIVDSVELAARVDVLEVPFRSIGPVVEIFPSSVFVPVPARVRLPRLEAEVKTVVSNLITVEFVLMSVGLLLVGEKTSFLRTLPLSPATILIPPFPPVEL